MASLGVYKFYSFEFCIHDYSHLYWRELKINKNDCRINLVVR